MPRSEQSWERMYERLVAFRKQTGHCDVATNSADDPQLGRWVATQRHKRKIGRLTDQQIQRLDSLFFTWSAAEASWDRMCRALDEFKKHQGHCNVPAHWEQDLSLATWVANQRHRRKIGALPPPRVSRLDAMGFTWGIYRQAARAPEPAAGGRAAARRDDAPAEATVAPLEFEQRLYNVGHGGYVQYDGNGERPKELVAYMAQHRGNLPAFIPLPAHPTVFVLSEGYARKPRKAPWKGRGRLPREVLEYVVENGILPPQDDGGRSGKGARNGRRP